MNYLIPSSEYNNIYYNILAKKCFTTEEYDETYEFLSTLSHAVWAQGSNQ